MSKDDVYMKYLNMRARAIENGESFGEFCEYCHAPAERDKNGSCKKCGALLRNPYGYCLGIPVYDADDMMILETYIPNYPTPETFQRIRRSLKPSKGIIREIAYIPGNRSISGDAHSAGVLADDFLNNANESQFKFSANIFYTKGGQRCMILRYAEVDGSDINSSISIIDASLGKKIIVEKILRAINSNA